MFPYRLGTYVFPTNVYVPEVYRERTYHLYGHPSRVHRALSRSEPDTTYNFSTLRTTGRLDDGPQTVEQLIRQGYLSIPNSEPETAVISDRKSTSWMGLDNAIAQIRGRQQIYRANIDAIDQSMCDAVNELYGHEAAQGHTATDGQRRTLAQRLQDLSEEKRAQRIQEWKDESRLRQDLPETARQYLSAYRKLAMLEDDDGGDSGGDSP